MGSDEELLEGVGPETPPEYAYLLGITAGLKARIAALEEMERHNAAAIAYVFEIVSGKRSKVLDKLMEEHPSIKQIFSEHFKEVPRPAATYDIGLTPFDE